ncbi:MAG: FHA domain-containing protein [Myxococcales bacterium]|nr:FHA domain-containing protein [Myxococcales bacterium]
MTNHRLALTSLILVALAGTAIADISKWVPEVIDGEPTEKVKNPPPSIRVKMYGDTLPAQDVWSTYMLAHARDDMKKPPPGVKPTKAIPYHKSNETLGLVILVEGHEYYFGNDTYKQAQDCKDPALLTSGQACRIVKPAAGVYTVIRGALEAPGGSGDDIPVTISRAGPPGSKGALLVYSAGTEQKFQGDLKDLTAEKLGDQRAQEGKTSRELVDGLNAAQLALNKIGTNRKALFVFSDGFDAGEATEIQAIKKKLDADKVEVFTFYLESSTDFIPDDAETVKRSKTKLEILASNGGIAAKAKDQDALKIAITSAVQQLNSRYLLVFPGSIVDPKTKRKAGFNWDGNEHTLTLKLGDGDDIMNTNSQGEDIPTTLVLAPKWGQSKGGSLWWLWIVIPGGVLLLGIIIASLGGKKQPAPAPVMVAAPVAPPPPMSAPSNPAKTMMVNISTGDGLPVVGWIVPTTGEKQFQTFKLQYGETRIGTTSNSHVVLNDGFMSTDHAKIVMSPTGFTLVDNNSTNGTFANERRIQRHELVDNDMIMFGKTVCKFKTILGT